MLIRSLGALLLGALFSLHAGAQTPPPPPSQPKSVLLVLSSEGSETRPGFDFDEYAQAYQVFTANGLRVAVASPRGGGVKADKFKPQDPHIAALPPEAHALLRDTQPTQALLQSAAVHDAVLVIGGKGAMFDLPKDAALASYLARHVQRGGVLAAVCHGPAALAAVQIDGKPLVQGRRVTGFTNEEEAVFGKQWAKEFPWWLETQLRGQGALWEEGALMAPHLVVDGRLVTGQNPFSTPAVAEAVVRLLGQTPVARPIYPQEASLLLAQRWLAGERDGVRLQLASELPRHQPALIALLGHYRFEAAGDDAQRHAALQLMELAAPHFQHPEFTKSMQRARAALQRQL